MKTAFPTQKLEALQTPFYYYDMELLKETLTTLTSQAKQYGYHLHYAVKANANPRILSAIKEYGLGADCVSGGEIQASLDAGFPASRIVFAGVGKADWEIKLGLDNDIFCFNAESIPELQVIDELASQKGKVASVALRLNPDVSASTHQNINTGSSDKKFGIDSNQLEDVLKILPGLSHVKMIGIHFHIGSQILELNDFRSLCNKVENIQQKLAEYQIFPEHLNFGGGLGIDYENPDAHPIADFDSYFKIFSDHVKIRPGQQVHFEPGRAVVGQCGALISKVLYVKENPKKKFVILDAGFTDLIRPAFYQAKHKIENLTSSLPEEVYDVVGPICESSDCFAEKILLNQTRRGDLIVFRSAGAYGEIMTMQYNCRELPKAYYSDLLS